MFFPKLCIDPTQFLFGTSRESKTFKLTPGSLRRQTKAPILTDLTPTKVEVSDTQGTQRLTFLYPLSRFQRTTSNHSCKQPESLTAPAACGLRIRRNKPTGKTSPAAAKTRSVPARLLLTTTPYRYFKKSEENRQLPSSPTIRNDLRHPPAVISPRNRRFAHPCSHAESRPGWTCSWQA